MLEEKLQSVRETQKALDAFWVEHEQLRRTFKTEVSNFEEGYTRVVWEVEDAYLDVIVYYTFLYRFEGTVLMPTQPTGKVLAEFTGIDIPCSYPLPQIFIEKLKKI